MSTNISNFAEVKLRPGMCRLMLGLTQTINNPKIQQLNNKVMNTDNQGIYDARKLGLLKFTVLGVQHLFAMFGATILVPLCSLQVWARSSSIWYQR